MKPISENLEKHRDKKTELLFYGCNGDKFNVRQKRIDGQSKRVSRLRESGRIWL